MHPHFYEPGYSQPQRRGKSVVLALPVRDRRCNKAAALAP